MQPFPHLSDATHQIWSRLTNRLQRYSSLKVWTTTDDDGRMDDGPLVYYKLTWWAFGSGELKMEELYRYLNILWPNSTNFPNSPCMLWVPIRIAAESRVSNTIIILTGLGKQCRPRSDCFCLPFCLHLLDMSTPKTAGLSDKTGNFSFCPAENFGLSDKCPAKHGKSNFDNRHALWLLNEWH